MTLGVLLHTGAWLLFDLHSLKNSFKATTTHFMTLYWFINYTLCFEGRQSRNSAPLGVSGDMWHRSLFGSHFAGC